MITPEFLNEVVRNTEDVVSNVNEYLIARIAKRIAGAFEDGQGNLIIPASQADMKMLMRGGMLYSEIEEEIKKRLPQIENAVHEAFMKSAQEIAEQNTDFAKAVVKEYGIEAKVPDFEKVDIPKSAKSLNMTPSEIRTLEDMYTRTNNTVKNMVNSSAKIINTDFYNACDDAFTKVQRGVPIDQAITEAIKQVADKGIETVEYKTGKVDKVEVAVARAVRTGINQANSNIVLTRCAEMGIGYVKVSEHLGARVTKNQDFTNHAHWQGKVYKIDWNSEPLRKYGITEKVENENEKSGFGWLNKIRQFFTRK